MASTKSLPKCPTGIRGLDEITDGGLPRGRPTLVCGTAGCGKTLLAIEFLVRGALEHDEPGVFVSFEETEAELAANVASFGWDLQELVESQKLALDRIHLERSEIQETGDFDLEGLFIRLGGAIDSVGAKRVALDTLEALFGGFSDQAILRAELRRLFRWLKEKGVTAIITGERGDVGLTRHGIEEYVSDCVIDLDHRITEQIATRRLRVVKYRGAQHGTNEYPFVIGEDGLNVLPITSVGLDYDVTTERMSTGIARLDAMLGGQGVYRGTSVLVSGTAGTGKSSVAASFVHAACGRGERCLYVSFEESPRQVMRNMRSIGIDLGPWVDGGLLRFLTSRSTTHGIETHLAILHRAIEEFDPQVVAVDPISNLTNVATVTDVTAMLARLIDYLKGKGITAAYTDLTHGEKREVTETEISSLMDTWILLQNMESNGERNRGLYLLKSRGMAHSNQIREFLLTDGGIELANAYVGPSGVLTGTARASQVAKEEAERTKRDEDIDRLQRELERKRVVAEAQIKRLRAELDAEEDKLASNIRELELREEVLQTDRGHMENLRWADGVSSSEESEQST